MYPSRNLSKLILMQLPSVSRFVGRIFLLWLAFGALPEWRTALAAPANDNCSGAIVIPASGATPFVFLTQPIDVSTATVTASDPPLPPQNSGFDTNIGHSVWFKFTPATSGLHTFSTGPDTYTSFRDTTMVVYTAANDCGPFAIYSHNEDSGTLRASVSTNFTAGTLYYIVVWVGRLSLPANAPNEILELQLRVSKPEVPANDNCANALVLPSNITAPYLTAIIDTTLATTTSSNLVSAPCVTNAGAIPSRDVWFRFTPATAGTYNFSTGSDTRTVLGIDGNLIDDTSIGLYTLPNGCGQAGNQIACNDNGLGRAVLSAALTAGTTYFIVVWDNAPAYVPGETALRLRVSPATRPTVETLGPISLSSTGVVLSGNVNGNGVLSRYWFEWGLTTSLGSTSAVKLLFAGANTFYTNIVVSGFQRDTEYQYRMVATNALGRSEGALQTFMWLSDPPQNMFFYQDVDGTFPIEFTGEPSYVYVVQGSSNLVDWIDLGTAKTNTTQTTTGYLYRHSPPVPAPTNFFFRLKLP